MELPTLPEWAWTTLEDMEVLIGRLRANYGKMNCVLQGL